MALSPCFSNTNIPYSQHNPKLKPTNLIARNRKFSVLTKCESGNSSSSSSSSQEKEGQLQVGTPIVIVNTPTMIKTAASMPCLRVNNGLVKPCDVGRIVSRKPKDVWAVRFAIGTYLIDGKYFKPLVLDQ